MSCPTHVHEIAQDIIVNKIKQSTDEERLSELHEEVRQLSGLNSWTQYKLECLRKTRAEFVVRRYLATNLLAPTVQKKNHYKMHACLWRGIIAVRKRSILALRKEKGWAKRDSRWMAKRLKRIVRETLPLQRECEALEKKVKEQTDSIHKWFDNLPQEEASFSRWYEEDMKADS